MYPYLAGSGKNLFADMAKPTEWSRSSIAGVAERRNRREAAYQVAVADSRSVAAAAGPAPT